MNKHPLENQKLNSFKIETQSALNCLFKKPFIMKMCISYHLNTIFILPIFIEILKIFDET